MSVDVLLDRTTWDLPARTAHARGIEVTAQKVGIRLKRFLGEWFLDESKGLDYYSWSQEKEPDVAAIGTAIRIEVETTTGVLYTSNWEESFDRVLHKLTYTFTVVCEEGEVEIEVSPIGDGPANRNPALTIGLVTGGSRRIGP